MEIILPLLGKEFLMNETNSLTVETHCFHCGDNLPENPYPADDKQFCCLGCKGVYQILSTHNLSSYYLYNDVPGSSQQKKKNSISIILMNQV
ncbi:heavy metal translocating P-type ATPase metal-binding domain-containing protein [Pedobacter sp. NJ-S-72]